MSLVSFGSFMGILTRCATAAIGECSCCCSLRSVRRKSYLPKPVAYDPLQPFGSKRYDLIFLQIFGERSAGRTSRLSGTVRISRRASRIRALLQQYGQASLIEDRHAERAGLVVLSPGILPGHDKAGLLRDRACHFPAENLHRLAGLGPAVTGKRAGDD